MERVEYAIADSSYLLRRVSMLLRQRQSYAQALPFTGP